VLWHKPRACDQIQATKLMCGAHSSVDAYTRILCPSEVSIAMALRLDLASKDTTSGFDDGGYRVLRRFLRNDETARVQTLVDEALRSPHETACNRPNNMLLPLRWNNPIIQLLLGSERRLRALCEAIGADDLRWISGYISIKEPRSPALWWHSDWWCWDHPISIHWEASQVAVLTYLNDTSVDNGALRILPRSHHESASIHAHLPEAHSKIAEELSPEDEAMRDLPDEVTLDLRSGDSAVIDYRLLHGTHPNSSNDRRDCILLSFTPSWRRLPDDLKSHLIQHPALPSDGEHPGESLIGSKLFPTFEGARRSLSLNRNAPARFLASD
jgi:hypothetical protein